MSSRDHVLEKLHRKLKDNDKNKEINTGERREKHCQVVAQFSQTKK